ncbi:MAG TPA: GNAT family N-acetyltransferase [Acidimicrobiales bacterium]|nr:GNAT family N-acetyltransferase [Acidimicrobiales bacterium]
MTLSIERVVVADPELVAAVRRLLPQLSETAQPPEAYDLESIVTSPATTMLVARDDDRAIVGMLTLALFRLPSAVRAWIEDVVVDESARRLGAGRALVEAALALAVDAGAGTVDLTSRPSRESARRLYETMGFEERTTTVFRRNLP